MEFLIFVSTVWRLSKHFSGVSDKLLAVPKVNFIFPEFVGPKFGTNSGETMKTELSMSIFATSPTQDKVSLNELQIYDDGMLYIM